MDIDRLLKLALDFDKMNDNAKRETLRQFAWLEKQNKFLNDIRVNIGLKNELGKLVVMNALDSGICPKCGSSLEERDVKLPDGNVVKKKAYCKTCQKSWYEGTQNLG